MPLRISLVPCLKQCFRAKWIITWDIYSNKTLKTSYGDVPIEAPRDRDASFGPKVNPKRTTNNVLSMYAKGMSQRDIAATIE